MERLRWVLPIVTALLPLVADKVHALHGAAAGLIALGGLSIVDGLCWLDGGIRYDTQSSRPVSVGRFYTFLFYVYSAVLAFSFADFLRSSATMSAADTAGHVFSWVIILGLSTLVIGHILIHDSSRLHRAIGQALFSLINYPDFPMIHVHEHHRHVATAQDCQSPAPNETFYAFFVRGFLGELACAWRPAQLRRAIALSLMQLALLAVVWKLGGLGALAIYLLTTFLARVVIALVNYVQHYGLRRVPGQKPLIEHSWDLPHRSTSWFYFNAGFHADHHVKAALGPDEVAFRSTRYVLPYNVHIIIPMALVPWLFFRAVNPILNAPE